jgi:hypothetical protein
VNLAAIDGSKSKPIWKLHLPAVSPSMTGGVVNTVGGGFGMLQNGPGSGPRARTIGKHPPGVALQLSLNWSETST